MNSCFNSPVILHFDNVRGHILNKVLSRSYTNLTICVKCIQKSLKQIHTHTHTRTHAGTLTRSLARTHFHTHTRARARARARTHTHTHITPTTTSSLQFVGNVVEMGCVGVYNTVIKML